MTLHCEICEHDQTTVPSMVLARWQDQDICLDCLETRPGKAEAEAQARGIPRPVLAVDVPVGCLLDGPTWRLVALEPLGAGHASCPHVTWELDGRPRLPKGLVANGNWQDQGTFETLLCYDCVQAAVRQHVLHWDQETLALAFLVQVSRLTKDGEEVDGKEFVMENDDAVTTLNGIIECARRLLGQVEAQAVRGGETPTPAAEVAAGGEPTGRYCVRTVALLYHDGDCDSDHVEEADEVMDPEGNTIAYILDESETNRICALLNQARPR